MKPPRIYRAAVEWLEATAADVRASTKALEAQQNEPEQRETGADTRVETAPNPEPDELHAHHYRSVPPTSRQAGFVITTPEDPRTRARLHAQTRPAAQTHKYPHQGC